MTDDAIATERTHTLVIGGGQSGLAVGYWLKQQGIPFLILDASARVGDAWRSRWDSLRLFTPARFDALPGLPFPAHPESFPSKDQMADYLQSYAAHFDLPVRSGVRVDRLTRTGTRFVARAGGRRYEAENVVVAMARYQRPVVPAFARELSPDIVQMHSIDYRNPSQLQPGDVLLVGAGNSGADIAMELAATNGVWMAGRNVGQLPFRIGGFLGRKLLVRIVLRLLFHRVLTVDTPVGRRARPGAFAGSGPLIRVREADLKRSGVRRAARVTGVRDGRPHLEDGRTLDVANVIWCTGFQSGFPDWIDLPVHGEHEPLHRSGVVESQPGLYFVGLHFLHSMSSGMVHGVERDARRIVQAIAGLPRADTAPVSRPRNAGHRVAARV